jgi:hypothetical protein
LTQKYKDKIKAKTRRSRRHEYGKINISKTKYSRKIQSKKQRDELPSMYERSGGEGIKPMKKQNV